MCSGVAVGEAGIGRELYAQQAPSRRSHLFPLCDEKCERSNTVRSVERQYVQLNQPSGVPPLPLTGERTLPDVPAENYWYRRHLVVYEWIARRVHGLRVLDM